MSDESMAAIIGFFIGFCAAGAVASCVRVYYRDTRACYPYAHVAYFVDDDNAARQVCRNAAGGMEVR